MSPPVTRAYTPHASMRGLALVMARVMLAGLATGCSDDGVAVVPEDMLAAAALDLPPGCPRAEDGGPCLALDAGSGDMSCVREDRCGGVCTDRQRDPRNCGRCGAACALGDTCIAGECAAIPCPECKCQGTIGMPGVPLSPWANAVGLSPGDFDGDGTLDLAAANYYDAGLLLGSGNGVFHGGRTTGADPGPADVATGDFNGDKLLDMAVVAGGSNSVAVVWGDGKGGYGGRVTLATELGPAAVVAADLDGDGRSDVITADSRSNVVSVYLALPGNKFGAHATYVTGATPVGVVVADLDGDGKLDLATADAGDSDVAVLRGNGDGTFLAPVRSPAGRRPTWIASGEFNGDGKPDLVVANPDDRAANALMNAGSGKLAAPLALAFTPGVDRVITADLDGDGKAEVVVASASRGRAGVFANRGNGSFAPAVPVLGGQAPSAMAVGDFNNDGQLDVALANTGYGAITTLLGDGRGALVAPPFGALSEPARFAAAAGDLDGNGTPDLVTAGNGGIAVVLMGMGGVPGAATVYPTGTTRPVAMVLADVDGDKKLDVVTAGENNSPGGAVTTLLGDGTGKLGAPRNESASCTHPGGVIAADLDADGVADVVVTCADDGHETALVKGKAIRMPTTCKSAGHLAAGDLDGDALLDLVVACPTGQGTAVMRGGGGGHFDPPAAVTFTGSRPVWVGLADFDGDKRLDIATRSADGQPSLNVSFADGKGGYTQPVMAGDDSNPYAASVVGDFDGDGRPDLAAIPAFYPSVVVLLLHRAGQPFVPGGMFTFGSGGPAQLAAADFNGDGALDLAAASTGTALTATLLQRCWQ